MDCMAHKISGSTSIAYDDFLAAPVGYFRLEGNLNVIRPTENYEHDLKAISCDGFDETVLKFVPHSCCAIIYPNTVCQTSSVVTLPKRHPLHFD